MSGKLFRILYTWGETLQATLKIQHSHWWVAVTILRYAHHEYLARQFDMAFSIGRVRNQSTARSTSQSDNGGRSLHTTSSVELLCRPRFCVNRQHVTVRTSLLDGLSNWAALACASTYSDSWPACLRLLALNVSQAGKARRVDGLPSRLAISELSPEQRPFSQEKLTLFGCQRWRSEQSKFGALIGTQWFKHTHLGWNKNDSMCWTFFDSCNKTFIFMFEPCWTFHFRCQGTLRSLRFRESNFVLLFGNRTHRLVRLDSNLFAALARKTWVFTLTTGDRSLRNFRFEIVAPAPTYGKSCIPGPYMAYMQLLDPALYTRQRCTGPLKTRFAEIGSDTSMHCMSETIMIAMWLGKAFTSPGKPRHMIGHAHVQRDHIGCDF